MADSDFTTAAFRDAVAQMVLPYGVDRASWLAGIRAGWDAALARPAGPITAVDCARCDGEGVTEGPPDADGIPTSVTCKRCAGLGSLNLHRPAGDAGAMRERAAKVCDDLATDVAFRDSSRSNEATCALSECATAIRALPLPAPADAVEEALRAFYEAAEACYATHDGVEIAGAGLNRVNRFMGACAALYAALRRAKGGTGG